MPEEDVGVNEVSVLSPSEYGKTLREGIPKGSEGLGYLSVELLEDGEDLPESP